jgi:hypothetical protein
MIAKQQHSKGQGQGQEGRQATGRSSLAALAKRSNDANAKLLHRACR